MVYWHDDTGEATVGKHMSDVCSETGQIKGNLIILMAGERLEEDRLALTLLGPRPPKAEGDEGYDDEDEGPKDNHNYEVGEVAGPMHDTGGGL